MNASNVRELVVEAIKGKTVAEDRVFSPRSWPTTTDMYPLIKVQTPFDVKNSMGRNAPSFTSTTTVLITGLVSELDSDDVDDGDLKAELSLEQLREQIERAVINSYELTRQIQQFTQIRSTIDINSDGEGHVGQLLMEIDIEYFQGPSDFYPIETNQLAGIDITIDMPDGTTRPGVKINYPE